MLLTLKAPRRKRVGSRPTEKMRRRMVMMTSARTPSGWGMMITMMSVAKTPIHSSADRWGSSITDTDTNKETKKCKYAFKQQLDGKFSSAMN